MSKVPISFKLILSNVFTVFALLQFRVRAVFGQSIKPIELNRNNYSFNEVRDEVRVKHELRDFQLRYVSPSLGDLFVQDNDSFRRVCFHHFFFIFSTNQLIMIQRLLRMLSCVEFPMWRLKLFLMVCYFKICSRSFFYHSTYTNV